MANMESRFTDAYDGMVFTMTVEEKKTTIKKDKDSTLLERL